jgi:hypothetical protein
MAPSGGLYGTNMYSMYVLRQIRLLYYEAKHKIKLFPMGLSRPYLKPARPKAFVICIK